MALHYSRTGFPGYRQYSGDIGTELLTLLGDLGLSDNQDFDTQLSIIEKILTIDASFGNVFSIVLEQEVPMSLNAKRALLVYAEMAQRTSPPIGVTSMDSWLVMLDPKDGEVRETPKWTAAERELLQTMQGAPIQVYKMFSMGAGVPHYLDFLRLRYTPI